MQEFINTQEKLARRGQVDLIKAWLEYSGKGDLPSGVDIFNRGDVGVITHAELGDIVVWGKQRNLPNGFTAIFKEWEKPWAKTFFYSYTQVSGQVKLVLFDQGGTIGIVKIGYKRSPLLSREGQLPGATS